MSELYAAAERLTATLTTRMDLLLRPRGLAARPLLRTVFLEVGSPGGNVQRVVQVVTTMMELPMGQGAVLRPRGGPEPDGESWVIEVQRADGLCRERWAGGIAVRHRDLRDPHSRYVLWMGPAIASDDALDLLIDDLARPLEGAARQSIFKVWKMRFGNMPPAVVARLEQVEGAEALDRMEAAVLSAAEQGEAAAAFGTG